MLDMGLGTSKGNFDTMSEEEYESWLWADDEEEEQDDGIIEITDDENEEAVAMLMVKYVNCLWRWRPQSDLV